MRRHFSFEGFGMKEVVEVQEVRLNTGLANNGGKATKATIDDAIKEGNKIGFDSDAEIDEFDFERKDNKQDNQQCEKEIDEFDFERKDDEKYYVECEKEIDPSIFERPLEDNKQRGFDNKEEEIDWDVVFEQGRKEDEGVSEFDFEGNSNERNIEIENKEISFE